MQLDPGFTSQEFAAHIVVEAIAAFFGTLGALFVAWLIYKWTRADQQAIFEHEAQRTATARDEEERRQHSAIRTALHHEVTDNLRRLEEFWPRIVLPSDEKDSAEATARRLVRTAVPPSSTGIWQGAAAMIAVALPREQLNETYRLYTTLAEISETQHRLQVAVENDAADYAAQPEIPSHFGMAGTKFPRTDNVRETAAALLPGLDERVKAVLTQGNPMPTNAKSGEPIN